MSANAFPSSFNSKNDFYIFFRNYLKTSGIVSSKYQKELLISIIHVTPDDVNTIKLYFPFHTTYEHCQLSWEGVDALEILHQLVMNTPTIIPYDFLLDTYNQLLYYNNGKQTCKMVKTDERAIIPFKHRVSDVGYDLTIIEQIKQYGSKTIMFDTFIKVQPPIGYYTKIVPRSSLIKSGYMLTNSVGIIDGGYTNTLKICLTKIDDDMPDLTLPFTCCQLILEKLNHYEINICDKDLTETSRGLGGFGSTNA